LGFPETAAQLLAHGAQANAEDEHGTRALHAAAQFAFSCRDGERARRTMEVLLEAGAGLDARNSGGQTALLLLLGAHAPARSAADQKQLLALLPLLLERGTDVNAQDKRGVGALHACAMHGLLLPARALFSAGADPARGDLLGRTPSEIAHLLGFVDVAAELGVTQQRRAPA
jgi:ankyrin repeat protein